MNVCIANRTYRWIGGTDTFSFDMAMAFKRLGLNVFYYSEDMDGTGVTERYFAKEGIMQWRGQYLHACLASQQSGLRFLKLCPVVQTCHSIFTPLEAPMEGATAYVGVSKEIVEFYDQKNLHLIPNGIDLERYRPEKPLRQKPKVLSVCQGDDSLLEEACGRLGLDFVSVPKDIPSRIWYIERLMNNADIVVGIGRSLLAGMACGRAVISWDNRPLNPFTGFGYIKADNFKEALEHNCTGRGKPPIDTVYALVEEIEKYDPNDGYAMRGIAVETLNADINAVRYLELANIKVKTLC